jgi:hypothetical protein
MNRYSMKTIASACGIPVSTVRRHKREGRLRLVGPDALRNVSIYIVAQLLRSVKEWDVK